MTDWEYEKTINTPTTITIQYAVSTPSGYEKRQVSLQSTTWTENTTNYVTIQYLDRNGQLAEEDVAISRQSLSRNTAAAVNGALVKWRLGERLGLPSGGANRESYTAYVYQVTSEGPVLVRETVEEYISGYEFAGSLNIQDYTGVAPSSALFKSSVTITEYVQSTNVETGRAHTKTSTTRYMAMGLTQEGQQSAAAQMKEDSGDGVIINKVFNSMKALSCDGTEVRTSIGRAPKPSRPAAQEILADQIVDSGTPKLDSAPGIGTGWVVSGPGRLPEYSGSIEYPEEASFSTSGDNSTDGGSLNDSPRAGRRTITAFEDGEATEDLGSITYEMPWAPDDYVTMGDWRDYDQDSDGDGVPDWAALVPDSWQDYDQDSDGDGVPDWASYVPDQWQDYDQDSDGDGVPDWAPFVPGNWQDYDQDSDGDGVPDWAAFVPTTWEEFDQDSNGDGVPDWADYVPTDWQDFDQDSDGDGQPDWAAFVPESDPELRSGQASRAARAFGEMMNALRIGNGLGANVTTTADRLDPEPFAPVYLNVGGLSVAMRLNGTSWAFDGTGIVASSDLLLCGVAGRTEAVSTSWVRLPVAPSGLALLEPAEEPTDPSPAYTVAEPAGFDPTNPGEVVDNLPTTGTFVPQAIQTTGGIVAPYLLKEPVRATVRHRMVVAEFPYRLTEEISVTASSKTKCGVAELVIVNQAAVVSTAASPVHVTGGLSIPVDAAVIQVAGDVQWVGSGIITMPFAEINVKGETAPSPSMMTLINYNSGFDGSGGMTASLNGSPSLDTTIKAGGASSLLLTPPDQSTPWNATYQLPQAYGLADFCVEFYVRTPASTPMEYGTIISFGSFWSVDAQLGTSRKFELFRNNSDFNSCYTGIDNSLIYDQWQHVAAYRVSGVFYLAIDGVVDPCHSPTEFDFNTGNDGKVFIVGDWNGDGGWNFYGNIDEIRISYGSSPYGASNFTPPPAPLT